MGDQRSLVRLFGHVAIGHQHRHDDRNVSDGIPDPNSQNRDSAAIQVKLDELIRVGTARNSMVGIEHLTDDELEDIRTRCEARAKAEKAGEQTVERTGQKARRAADRIAG